MTGGQIAALVCAIFLLLPGGCFLALAIGYMTDPDASSLLLIAASILAVAGLLFWVAFRRRPDRGGPPDTRPS
jgi:hypothetical protein